jgi:hypothetical protein
MFGPLRFHFGQVLLYFIEILHCEVFYLLGYNSMQSVKIQPAFGRNMLLSLGSMNKHVVCMMRVEEKAKPA